MYVLFFLEFIVSRYKFPMGLAVMARPIGNVYGKWFKTEIIIYCLCGIFLQWGSNVINILSQDLRHAFPDMKGLGSSNLHNMRRFADAYTENEFVQQAVGQIPWYHHVLLMEKVKNTQERLWYIQKTIENGWSRNVLALQVASKLYSREGWDMLREDDTMGEDFVNIPGYPPSRV